MAGFAPCGGRDSAKPTEERRYHLLDRVKPPKPALWNDPCVRPLGLKPALIASRVPADFAVEFRQGLARGTTEPEEGPELEGVLIEHQPEDAATRLVLQMAVDRDLF